MREVTPKDIFERLSEVPLEEIDAHSLDENAVEMVCGSHIRKEIFIGSTPSTSEYMKRRLDELSSFGYQTTEVGVSDYPSLSSEIGMKIGEDPFHRVGIGFGATGNDVLVLGPKYPFVIGSKCINEDDAKTAREHNNPNFLGIASYIKPRGAISTIIGWLSTGFYTGPVKEERRLRRYLQELRIKIEAYRQGCSGHVDDVDVEKLHGSLKGKEWILGSDHRGRKDLRKLVRHLTKLHGSDLKLKVVEGSYSDESDYPLISAMIGREVSERPLDRVGFGICGSGTGIGSGGLNFPGVYFARCLSKKDADGARLINSNFMGTGADIVGFGKHSKQHPFAIVNKAMDKVCIKGHPDLICTMYPVLREREAEIYRFARQLYGP